GRALQAGDQTLRTGLQSLVETRLAENLQRSQARRHSHRTARQRAGLVHAAQRRDALHDVAPTTESTDWHAAADDLAQRGEVRRHAGQALHALRADAEAGHDLVEDQHRTVLGTQLAQAFQKTRARLDQIHVAGHRLDDDRG